MFDRKGAFLPFPRRLQPAVIVDRRYRFILRCRRPDGGLVDAHLPNSGRLTGVLAAGGTAWLAPAEGPNRSTTATVHLVETPAGVTVGVDTSLPNRLVGQVLWESGLEELTDYRLERREVSIGRSRIDFLLRSPTGLPMLLEVKSVSWVEGGTGLFPDAVSARGTRHLRELAEAAGSGQYEAAVCFVVQRPDARTVVPARKVDPEFGFAFDEAVSAGVRFLGRCCHLGPEGVELGPAVSVAAG